ncbi:MYXO-CTERM sorting domain-containing protein [Nannocystis bainbridge]|uniref:MYXO-CTERM sorting domain-containing protein n=1 Tax=Nannocystis bainbridge TaxID=2995303 RepID=A0ABT5E596_9BACT|nr:MYXO-CTERM sorting domain-containing protein [Nannocystis bainbridge]MDC0719957.1 MYXO-CTERM sorting domain-containing protein [Nannocystis bainbridge]
MFFGTVLLAAIAGEAAAQEPFYLPVGDLIPGSGEGLADATVYAPGMRFPIEDGPAYPNSQVYRSGGYMGPPGSQCDPENYAYPWRDNYCEKRSWDMPLCPAGIGHQGQDIRPPTCEKDVHWVVAGRAGDVTNIGSYSVYVTSVDGQRLDYLHGAVPTLQVALGDAVVPGQRLVAVSNNMGDTPTSIHLHFNIRQDIGGVGVAFVSPYMSLVGGYEELMGLGNSPPGGSLDKADCASLVGWAQDPDAPEQSIAALLSFGGPMGAPGATLVEVMADVPRDDLCAQLGSCAHGFEVEVPLSLRDGASHEVHVYAKDDGQGAPAEVALSPGSFACEPPPLPTGVRRWVVDPESLAAWKLSPFWQMIVAPEAAVAALPEGADLPPLPILARSPAAPDTTWLIDQGTRRPVTDPAIAAAWQLDLEATETWAPELLMALPEGPPLRPLPVLVQGTGPKIYVLDDPLCIPGEEEPSCATNESSSGAEEPTSGSATSEDASSSSSSPTPGPASAGALPPGFGSEDGCGCRHAENPGAGLLVIASLAWRRRRRAGQERVRRT